MVQIVKVFRSGNSQAVRLPKEFRFNVNEVEISREGDALILRPPAETAPAPWASLRAAIARGTSPDFLSDGRQQPQPQDRTGLDEIFR